MIDRLLRQGTAVARADGTVHRLSPVAITGPEGEALQDWVKREAATRTVEIGLGYGIAALFVCDGLLSNRSAGGHHVVLDPNQETRFAGCGLQFLEEAGVAQMVEYHPQASEIMLPQFLAEGRRFDLAFVDGNHRFEGVFLDLIYLGRLMRPAGIIFVDDYQLPSVARAVSFCSTNLAWTIEEVSIHDRLHQWAVLRTPRLPVERGFDHYVDF